MSVATTTSGLMPAPLGADVGLPEDVPPGISAATVFDSRRPHSPRSDWLAEEVPVALVFNGITQAVMMATPLDLEDFAWGFASTEGLIEHVGEVRSIEVETLEQGVNLMVHVSAACEWRLKERRRTLVGRTGCGLCGLDSLEGVLRPLPPVPARSVGVEAIVHAQQKLRSWQTMQSITGATHAAAWVSLSGEIALVREDVGRHNALDKLIGALLRGDSGREGFICITSRASFEMVQKTLAAGVSILAAVSAPTALAVRLAQTGNLALAGFVRNDHLVAYSHAPRFFGP